MSSIVPSSTPDAGSTPTLTSPGTAVKKEAVAGTQATHAADSAVVADPTRVDTVTKTHIIDKQNLRSTGSVTITTSGGTTVEVPFDPSKPVLLNPSDTKDVNGTLTVSIKVGGNAWFSASGNSSEIYLALSKFMENQRQNAFALGVSSANMQKSSLDTGKSLAELDIAEGENQAQQTMMDVVQNAMSLGIAVLQYSATNSAREQAERSPAVVAAKEDIEAATIAKTNAETALNNARTQPLAVAGNNPNNMPTTEVERNALLVREQAAFDRASQTLRTAEIAKVTAINQILKAPEEMIAIQKQAFTALSTGAIDSIKAQLQVKAGNIRAERDILNSQRDVIAKQANFTDSQMKDANSTLSELMQLEMKIQDSRIKGFNA